MQADLDSLVTSIEDDEIKGASSSMKGGKASSPDGIHAPFYQTQWDIVCEFAKKKKTIMHDFWDAKINQSSHFESAQSRKN